MDKLNKKEIKSCIIFSSAVVVTVCIIFFFTSQIRYLTEGQISKERIVAPFDFYYFDDVNFQQIVSSNFRPIYVQDLQIADLALSRCEALFDRLLNLRRLPYRVAKERIDRDGMLKNLSSDILEKFLRCEDREFSQFREKTKNLLKFWLVEHGVAEAKNKKGSGEIMLHKVSKETTEKCTTLLEHIFTVDALPTPPGLGEDEDIVAVARQFVSPNVYFSRELTFGEKEKVIKEAKLSSQKLVKEGEVIVEANSVVTKEAASKLKSLSFHLKRVKFLHSIGASFMVIVIFLLWAIWIYRYHRHLFKTPKLMLILISLLLFILSLSKLFVMKDLGFLIPLGVAAMLSAILISDSIAYTLILVLCTIMVLCNGFDFASTAAILFVGSMVSILLISKAKVRFQIIKAAWGICVANIIVFSALFLLTKTKDQLILRDFMGMLFEGWLNWGLINSFFCCLLTLPLLSVFERSFRITTTFKLLELQDLNTQILKELLIYAPGTHHHSLIVSALVQEAATQIGANVELACTGAYYHDIGKLRNPMAFVENNIYKSRGFSIDELQAHIADGIEIAQRYRLPQPVIDIIKQHHGSSLRPYILYSFGELNEYEDKRYLIPLNGMKPTTKEAALVMLADIVEVAVRNLSDHEKIKELVAQIVRDYILNGQLSDVNLTLRELSILPAVFASKLIDISAHHIYL